MKVLVVGAIRGNADLLNLAFNTFLEEKHDRIIFTGNIFDCEGRTDDEVIRCANIMNAMLDSYPDKVVCLIGNSDEAYMRYNPERYRTKGFRPLLHVKLHPLLLTKKKHYKYAYGIGDYLFTHAGLQYGWLSKHFTTLDKCADMMGLDVTDAAHLWMVIDGVARTADATIIHEAGAGKGGADSDYGGPLWCGMDEMLVKGPYPGLHQVVGHTRTDHIYRFHTFQDKKRWKDTSVTYVDVLSDKTQFLTLNISS